MALILNKRSSINRILKLMLTGFPGMATEKSYIIRNAYKNHSIKQQALKKNNDESTNIIKEILQKTSRYIFKYLDLIKDCFAKRSKTATELKALEENLSITKPTTGGNTTDKILEFIKYME